MNAQEIRKYFSTVQSIDLYPSDSLHPSITESSPSFACVSIIVFQIKNQLELLFIERQKNPSDPWSGHIAFPGGKKTIEDITPIDAALRETKEEIGFELCRSNVIGKLDDLQSRKSGNFHNLIVRPYLFLLELKTYPQFVLNVNEVSAVHLVNLENLINTPTIKYFEYQYESQKISLPSIPLKENKIWGLTYLIIRNLQEHFIKMNYTNHNQLLPIPLSPNEALKKNHDS